VSICRFEVRYGVVVRCVPEATAGIGEEGERREGGGDVCDERGVMDETGDVIEVGVF
jgi:hypothetical protein